jgi:lipoyl(octanoyl) transferase
MKVDIAYSNRLIDYDEASQRMETFIHEIANDIRGSTIWLLEHPPLYTAGASANDQDLLEAKFPVYKVGRGGKYTYHGPGQRILYTMINLKQFQHKLDIRKFVTNLEEVVISSLKVLKVNGFLKEGMVGVWVDHNNTLKKIAAIGIRIKKQVSYHGMAININPNLDHFKGIIPCGIKEYGVTSLKELGIEMDLKDFDHILIQQFANVFGCKINKTYEI